VALTATHSCHPPSPATPPRHALPFPCAHQLLSTNTLSLRCPLPAPATPPHPLARRTTRTHYPPAPCPHYHSRTVTCGFAHGSRHSFITGLGAPARYYLGWTVWTAFMPVEQFGRRRTRAGRARSASPTHLACLPARACWPLLHTTLNAPRTPRGAWRLARRGGAPRRCTLDGGFLRNRWAPGAACAAWFLSRPRQHRLPDMPFARALAPTAPPLPIFSRLLLVAYRHSRTPVNAATFHTSHPPPPPPDTSVWLH